MYNDGYHFWGMHFGWWAVWIITFFWIFVTPYDIPGQRNPKTDFLEALKKRYAKGEITTEEYLQEKETL